MALMETRVHQGSANDTLGVDFTDAVGLARVTQATHEAGRNKNTASNSMMAR